jgi:hypothetical protein
MWGFIWIMLVLKLPLAAMIFIVWWAVRQKPEESPPGEDDGGTRRRRPHPPAPFPRRPRRGPHGDPAPHAPSRVRTTHARARSLDH